MTRREIEVRQFSVWPVGGSDDSWRGMYSGKRSQARELVDVMCGRARRGGGQR